MLGEVDYTLPLVLDHNFDKNAFKRRAIFFAVGLPLGNDFKRVSECLRDFATGYLNLPKFKETYIDSDGNKRKLSIIRRITDPQDWERLRSHNVDIPTNPNEEVSYLESHPETLFMENCPTGESDTGHLLPLKPSAFRMLVGYENLSLDHALKIALPPNIEGVTGFSVVGHVAHFNLKPVALPYRKIIGQIVLDKIPYIRTVVNKASKIDTEFRTFEVDLMAGEDNYLTEVKENGVTFHLDFSKVYWNSRLGSEHSRIIEEIKRAVKISSDKSCIVYDVFAGVGPFSVPLARSGGCQVLANDLNPASFQFLQENVHKNSSRKHPLTEEQIKCFNMDGREFLKEIVIPHYETAMRSGSTEFFVIMNLPGLAIEFLDVFKNVSIDVNNPKPLHIRCYCFVRHSSGSTTSKAAKHVEADKEARRRVCEALGMGSDALSTNGNQELFQFLRLTGWRVRFVRNTAPFKDMYCVEFDLHISNPPEPVKRSRKEL